MIKKFFTVLYLTIISSSIPAHAQFGSGDDTDTQSSLISSANSIAPGESFHVALKLAQPSGWHSYYHNDGIGISQSPNIKWTLPEGYTASELIFPTPHHFDSFGFNSYGYEGTHYFYTKITAPADLAAGNTATLTADASWQICKENCLQQESSHTIKITTATTTISNPAFDTELADYQKKYIPASTAPASWTVSATDTDKKIKIIVNADKQLPIDLKFYEYNGQLDAQKAIDISSLGKKATIKGVFNEGNDFSSGPAEKLDYISGILHSPSTELIEGSHSVFITTKWEASEPAGSKKKPAVTNPTKPTEDPHTTESDSPDFSAKVIAEKYDIDAKISIITLDRIDDDGNALDDDGNIILKENLFTDQKGNITNAEGKIIGVIAKSTFLYAAVLIFGGGLILNLMPCVFPVLGVKVLGFVQLSGNDPKKIKMHGIVFSLGVIASMWILAAVILVIRDSTGEGVAWGNQMKSPFFVGSMIILMAMFALNLYGVFEVGTSLTSAGGKLHAKKGYEGSFFSGVLTTLIATPCGAPLLATAMTYTLQQTIVLAMILFTIFGLGVAAPYLILSFFPALINKLPRPGAWMLTFKKSMAFPLLATVVFLMSAYVSQTGKDGIILMLWALVILSTAGFIYGNWGTPFISKVKRYTIGYGLAGILAIWGGYLSYQSMTTKPTTQAVATIGDPADIHSWTDWTPGLVDHHRSKKRIVWIDYTADW